MKILKYEYSELFAENNNDHDKSVEMSEENDRLRSLIEVTEKEEVSKYDADRNAFTPETQRCVYELLKNHAVAKNVGNVINAVLSLVKKHANRLPRISTVHNMNLLKLVLARKQISEVL